MNSTEDLVIKTETEEFMKEYGGFFSLPPKLLMRYSEDPYKITDSAKKPGLGVLDKPYSAWPAQRSSYTGPPGYRMDTVPAYVDWRPCTSTPLSGNS